MWRLPPIPATSRSRSGDARAARRVEGHDGRSDTFYCEAAGLPLGKFVIPNPFGPFEEPRFCAYLIRQWQAGQAAEVRTPAYVRDNIHVDLLEQARN